MLEEITLTTLRTLPARLNPAGDAWRTQWADEAAYWYARSAAERAPYTGQYVAVFKHTLVDHDPDRRALYTAHGHILRFCPCHRHARTLLSGSQADRRRVALLDSRQKHAGMT